MIINGGSRSNGAFFARHLMRADDNERVAVTEMRGFAHAEDVPHAFEELKDMAGGTRCKNWFYHANINTRADEVLTPEQWAQATDKLEHELHLDGQPRFIVEHEKEGRIHRHVVWSRVDADSMKTISDSHNYRTHELVATELEADFGHTATARALTRDKETTERPEPNVKDWESFRAAETKIDPKAMKAELTELWQQSDSGPAFAAALEDRGYILAKGDRRDFCIVDEAGDEHSLGRRLAGVKAADIRARMADVDQETLPSVAEARTLARNRPEPPAGETGDTRQTQPETPASEPPAAAIMETVAKVTEDHTAVKPPEEMSLQAIMRQQTEQGRRYNAPPAMERKEQAPQEDQQLFRGIMQEAAKQGMAARQGDLRAAQADQAGGHWQRFSAYLSTMREHVQGFGQQVRDYWNNHFAASAQPEAQEPPAATPTTTINGASATAQPMPPQYNGPELG